MSLSMWFFIIGISACNNNNETFEKLSIIEGKWTMKFDSSEVMEKWTKINDTLYDGISYDITGKDSVISERVKLVATADGIYYIPVVENQNGKKPVLFLLTESDHNKFVFQNPEHDFPSVITYEFINEDRLKAGISGKVNGELRSLDFDYIKVKGSL